MIDIIQILFWLLLAAISGYQHAQGVPLPAPQCYAEHTSSQGDVADIRTTSPVSVLGNRSAYVNGTALSFRDNLYAECLVWSPDGEHLAVQHAPFARGQEPLVRVFNLNYGHWFNVSPRLAIAGWTATDEAGASYLRLQNEDKIQIWRFGAGTVDLVLDSSTGGTIATRPFGIKMAQIQVDDNGNQTIVVYDLVTGSLEDELDLGSENQAILLRWTDDNKVVYLQDGKVWVFEPELALHWPTPNGQF